MLRPTFQKVKTAGTRKAAAAEKAKVASHSQGESAVSSTCSKSSHARSRGQLAAQPFHTLSHPLKHCTCAAHVWWLWQLPQQAHVGGKRSAWQGTLEGCECAQQCWPELQWVVDGA
jgi:hypothetical protein